MSEPGPEPAAEEVELEETEAEAEGAAFNATVKTEETGDGVD